VEEQTLITLIGLVVAVVALIVGFASLLHFSQKGMKEDLGKQITEAKTNNAAAREDLGQQIAAARAEAKEENAQARAEAKTDNAGTREYVGELIGQMRAEHEQFRDDARGHFAALRNSLDTLERRTFDIATGTAAES